MDFKTHLLAFDEALPDMIIYSIHLPYHAMQPPRKAILDLSKSQPYTIKLATARARPNV